MAVAGPRTAARTRWVRLSQWLEQLSDLRMFLVVLIPLFAIYLATATWSYPLINDAYTNSASAWTIANDGSVYLDEFEGQEVTYGFLSWIVPTGDSVVSKYPPGAALAAVPAYALWPAGLSEATYQPEDIDEYWRNLYPDTLQEPVTVALVPVGPGSVTAAFVTAAAMGLLAVVFRRLGGSGAMSVVAAYIAGLGTSAWPVAADQLWQHGPAMAWVALALFLSENHLLGSGLAYGAAILTRPPMALIAAGTGLMRSWRERSLRPALLVGIGASVGLAAFLLYNGVVFGDPSVSAGYGPEFQTRVVSGFRLGPYVRTLFDALFSREVGIFIWSPFLLVLLPGLRAGWKAAPSWARGSAVGAVVYLLVQYKANRATGGDFIGYRYPLESLVAMAPVLFLAFKERIASRVQLRRPLIVAVALAVLVQGLGAIGIGVV